MYPKHPKAIAENKKSNVLFESEEESSYYGEIMLSYRNLSAL